MKILLTGKGNSGAYQMRAVQIAVELCRQGHDARAIPKASVEECRAADVVVLVKRPTHELLDTIRASKRPFAHDVVDAWPQPEGNEWPRERALSWLHTTIEHVKPDLLICATRAMMEDAQFPRSCVIYHHARPEYVAKRDDFRPNPIVGYEGGLHYLGRYDAAIRSACREFCWTFDATSIADAAIALCLRDCEGYAPRHWKSQIKVANAQALGIPALCSVECGYKETTSGGIVWINSTEEIYHAIGLLSKAAYYTSLRATVDLPPRIEAIARQYVEALEKIA